MKILVHSCCGPCSTYSLDKLRKDGNEVKALFYNPNIHPYTEFEMRKRAFFEFAQKDGFEVQIEEEYGLETFLKCTKDFCYDKKRRCQECYKMRFEKAAEVANQQGYDAFSTTLTISPYQDHELILSVGEAVAAEFDVKFMYFDFREGYRKSINLSREMGLYRQKYCGCIISEEERYRGQE